MELHRPTNKQDIDREKHIERTETERNTKTDRVGNREKHLGGKREFMSRPMVSFSRRLERKREINIVHLQGRRA